MLVEQYSLTIVVAALAAFLAAGLGYALAKEKGVIRVVSREGDLTDTEMMDLCQEACLELRGQVEHHRPYYRYSDKRKPFKKGRGSAGMYKVFENVEDFDFWHMDWDEKRDSVLAAVERLAAKVERQVRLHGPLTGFNDPYLPGGLEYCGRVRDEESGVAVRLLRGFDLMQNAYIVQVAVEVRLG